MNIHISDGDILDKLSILELKQKFIKDEDQLYNIEKEFNYLKKKTKELLKNPNVMTLYINLKQINLQLWNIEDNIRIKEKEKQFDIDFINLARSVYITNDKRAEIKKEINILTQSKFIEEKSYEKY